MTLTVTPSATFPTTGGRDIAIFPAVSECTVAQAAQFLDGTEGLVRELMDAGLIAFRLENGEHLIERSSLSGYLQEEKRKHAWLDEIVLWDQEMGLYDD